MVNTVSSIQVIIEKAITAFNQGSNHDAQQLCQMILNIDPKNAGAFEMLSILAYMERRFDIAAAMAERAIKISNNVASYHYNFGKALVALEDWNTAKNQLFRAIRLTPSFADAYFQIGCVLRYEGKHREAIEYFERAFSLDNSLTQAKNNIGLCLLDLGETEHAVFLFRDILSSKPDNWETWINIANVFFDLRVFDEALACYHKAKEINPAAFVADYGIARIFMVRKQFEEAVESLRRSIAINPNFAEAHEVLGNILLLQSRFLEGWQEYEWRLKSPQLQIDRKIRATLNSSQWRGESLVGKTILLSSEQGLGDTIQFIRYAVFIAERGGVVIVGCQKPLKRLLKSVVGISRVISEGETLPSFDYSCALMSIPYVLKTTLESIPCNIPYISIDKDNSGLAFWTQKLNSIKGLKVGLCWAGNPLYKSDKERSIPLQEFLPVLALGRSDVNFVSLQKGRADNDLSKLPPGVIVYDPTRDVKDFLDLAAIVANLDLVISVDSAPAHLAGAMGKPVWLLSRYIGCWRWLLGRNDSPWYPSMRIFRQPKPDDWKSVIGDVKVELEQLTQHELNSPLGSCL